MDDLLQDISQGQPIRTKGFAPALNDNEVITMKIVAEYQDIDTDIQLKITAETFYFPMLQQFLSI